MGKAVAASYSLADEQGRYGQWSRTLKGWPASARGASLTFRSLRPPYGHTSAQFLLLTPMM
jgi:hypothetical protein